MLDGPLRIYFSASNANAPMNARIASRFAAAGMVPLLPHEIAPRNLSAEMYPREIYQQCLRMMESADAGLVVLDSYGNDSSWEVGWFQGRGKPVFGWVAATLRFTKDWMVKNGLTAVLTVDPDIAEALADARVLPAVPVILVSSAVVLRETVNRLCPGVVMCPVSGHRDSGGRV